MKRRQFIKTAGLGLLSIPTVIYGTKTKLEKPSWLVRFGYAKGWAKPLWIWHGDDYQSEPKLGQLVTFAGPVVYTVIEITPFTRGLVSSILLDRPLERDIQVNELGMCGHIHSFTSIGYFGPMQLELSPLTH